MDSLGLKPLNELGASNVDQLAERVRRLDPAYTAKPFTASPSPEPRSISVSEFEQALEDYTASMIWASKFLFQVVHSPFLTGVSSWTN